MTATQATRPKRVGDVLVERGLLGSEQLQQALAAQKQTGNRRLLGEIVVELGYCSEANVVEALAEAYEVPFASLNQHLVDPRVSKLLPKEFIDQHCVLPMFQVDGRLTVAVTEPSNLFLIEEIARKTDLPVQVVAATRSDIAATREQLAQLSTDGDALVIDEMPEGMAEEAVVEGKGSTGPV